MYTDPIADYLTRVRNAVAANHKVVEIPASNLKEITKILFDQGYILSYKFEDNAVQGSIKIALKYDKDTKESVIKISKELVNQVYVNIQVLLIFQESLMD
jgi:small subunit ribosomal protein S8